MSKIAVLFPGIGYTCDKPLLYYSAKLAAEKGYEVVRVPYGNFPPNVKGDAAKMYQCFVSAREQSEDILKDVAWSDYDEIVFFSKSVGTVVALSYASEHGINVRQVLYTPLVETFRFPVGAGVAGVSGAASAASVVSAAEAIDAGKSAGAAGETDAVDAAETSDVGKSSAIAFHGTGDPWAVTEEIVRICEEKGVPLYLTKDANHSLECGKAMKDIKTIRKVMRIVKKFL